MAPDPVTRGWGQAGPGVRVVGLGRWVGVRSPGQGHGRVLPVIGVVGLVMSGLGLGLRHTQQLGVTHPLCLLPVVSVARGEGHVTRAQPSRPGVQTILQRVTMAMGHGGQSGGSVSVSGGGELPPLSPPDPPTPGVEKTDQKSVKLIKKGAKIRQINKKNHFVY